MIPAARFSDLGRILQQYPAALGLEPARFSQAAGGFSGARVWKVESPAGPFALRGMDAGVVDVARLAELHRLMAHVHARGLVQAPVALASCGGETFVAVEGVIWQLEPWMPGAADFCQRPGRARLAACMTCLARWHLAAASFVPRAAGREWFFSLSAGASPGLAARCRQIADWNRHACAAVRAQLDGLAWPDFASLARQILDRFEPLAPHIAARLRPALAVLVPIQPCLRDVWHDHVLLTGDEVTGLIDPHSARSDCVATDLARLLGSLVGDDRPSWEAGLAAYQRVRPLSPVERSLVELFDQSSVLLSGMTWLDWCCRQGRTFSDRDKVVSRLRVLLARLDHLARNG